jgi:hypothetical protein
MSYFKLLLFFGSHLQVNISETGCTCGPANHDTEQHRSAMLHVDSESESKLCIAQLIGLGIYSAWTG